MVDKNNFLNGTNAPYIAELFVKYKQDIKSVDSSWVVFFQSLNENETSILSDFKGPYWKKRRIMIHLKNLL